jgi:DNA repair photolyase
MGEYKFITCKAALNKIKGNDVLPYRYDLNVYRGCEHGCIYCFAVYSHAYLENSNYFGEIYVKTNVAEALERQLASKNWDRSVINLGGVTDSYQPCEATFKLMPDIIKLLIKYKTPAIISTKSDLILRDFDLLAELASITYLNVAATITCADDSLQAVVEPGGVSSTRRFAMLREFRRGTEASTGVHVMPIIPYINDSADNLDRIFAATKAAEIHYLITASLNLRGMTKKVFLDYVRRYFPAHVADIYNLYREGRLDRGYKQDMYRIVGEMYRKHGVTANYQSLAKARAKSKLTPIEELLLPLQA